MLHAMVAAELHQRPARARTVTAADVVERVSWPNFSECKELVHDFLHVSRQWTENLAQ